MIDTSKYTNEELEEMFHEQQRQRAALQFVTSGRYGIGITKERAFLTDPFEDLLIENVDLYKYVKKENISQIAIIYQIFNIEEEEKMNIDNKIPPHYNEQKVLRTYPLMTKDEYKRFVCCSKEEALQLLAQKTLDGIAELQEYAEKLNFDWQGLCSEMKELFEREFSTD